MSTLEDGIYLGSAYDRASRPLWVVQDGHYGATYPLVGGVPAPTRAADDWTRIADLPDLRMPEPDQIGYPVMAGCLGSSSPHLHLRRVSPDYPWHCRTDSPMYQRWASLIDPRDLTPDEIAEHGLWTGGAR